jgi:hypothetical protein
LNSRLPAAPRACRQPTSQVSSRTQGGSSQRIRPSLPAALARNNNKQLRKRSRCPPTAAWLSTKTIHRHSQARVDWAWTCNSLMYSMCAPSKLREFRPPSRPRMNQEMKVQQYHGVICGYCRQPIPVPGIVERLMGDETHSREARTRVFNLRCRACEKEKQYHLSDIVEFEGSPRPRSMRARVPLVRREPKAAFAARG